MTTVEGATDEAETRPPRAQRDRGLRRHLLGPGGFLLAIVLQLVVIWPIASKRAFDGDEGFYAMAAKLVAHGHQPYFDFWFQYTPGLPYVYGAWTRLTSETFQSLRTLSALLTIALGLVLYAHVAKRHTRSLGVAAVTLYITSALVFEWYSTYKSYVLSTLLLFLAYVVVADSDRGKTRSALHWFSAGVLLGLAVDVRLFFIALAPVFAYYAIDRTRTRRWFASIVPLLGGLVVGLIPCIYFFARGPRVFIDDTLLSQTNRSSLSLVDSVVQKLRTAGALLGTAQFLVLVAAAVALVIIMFRTRRRVPLAVAIAAMLGLASIAPSPTYDQYFSTLVPFLAIGAVELWQTIAAALPKSPDRLLAFVMRTVGIAGLLMFVLAGAGTFDTMLNSGDKLIDARHERLITKAIDAHTRSGEIVIDFDPTAIYESHTVLLSGLESDFGTLVAANLKLSEHEAKREKLLTLDQIVATIQSRKIRTVIVSPYDGLLFPRPWAKILLQSGYRPVETVLQRTIYQLPQT